MKKIKLSILSLLMLSLLLGSASGAVTIAGFVNMSAGEHSAISGATVVIVDGASGTTDATGYYNLTQAQGNVTIYVDAGGYYRNIKYAAILHTGLGLNFSLNAPNYTLSDMDDIVVDNIAVAAVEVKSEIPNLVNMGMLYILLLMLVSIVGLALTIFLIVPQKARGVKKGRHAKV